MVQYCKQYHVARLRLDYIHEEDSVAAAARGGTKAPLPRQRRTVNTTKSPRPPTPKVTRPRLILYPSIPLLACIPHPSPYVPPR